MNEGILKAEQETAEVKDVKPTLIAIKKRTYAVAKRTFDFVFALVCTLLLLPVMLIVAILIRIDSKGNPIFIQKRIGKHGKTIKILKFRSMVQNGEAVLEKLMKENPAIKKEYLKNKKLENDPRITKMGKFIRKTSIDELPQIINILKGEMSLIGPRPYLFREKEDMGKAYNEIIKVKPGLTGLWQVSGRSDISFEERCELESFYAKNIGPKMDLKIFFKTFEVVLKHKGAK